MATKLSPTIKPTDVGLKREIGLIGATWASETSIIGSGWLLASFAAAQILGGAAIIAWLLGAVAIIILALVHAELGGMYPVAGGTARFPHLAFGEGAGIAFGFFSWLQAVSVAPIEAYAVIHYAGYWWHGIYNPNANGGNGNVTHWGFVLEIVLMAIFTALNFIALKWYNRISSAITWWKVAIPVLTIIIVGVTAFHSSNFSAGGGFFPHGVSMKDVFGALPGASIIFAYLGFEQADQLAGEVKNPQRNLPLAIILSILIGTVIYVLLQVVFIGATPVSALTHGGFAGIKSSDPLALAPFAALTGLVGLGWLSGILRADAFISPAGTGSMYLTATSRVSYGLARNRYYPGIFGKVDSRGIPWFGMVVGFFAGLIFTFPFPSWHSLVGLVTSASVLMYAGAPLSLGAFRNRLPGADRPFKLPGAAVISPLAFIISGLLVYWSGFETIWKLGVAIVLGYVLILFYSADRPEMAKIEWRKSAWIGAYLLGMGVISWQGAYGPQNTGRLAYPWDILVVAVFSLAIYYWAINNALTTEEIEAKIAAQSASSESLEAEPEAAA